MPATPAFAGAEQHPLAQQDQHQQFRPQVEPLVGRHRRQDQPRGDPRPAHAALPHQPCDDEEDARHEDGPQQAQAGPAADSLDGGEQPLAQPVEVDEGVLAGAWVVPAPRTELVRIGQALRIQAGVDEPVGVHDPPVVQQLAPVGEVVADVVAGDRADGQDGDEDRGRRRGPMAEGHPPGGPAGGRAVRLDGRAAHAGRIVFAPGALVTAKACRAILPAGRRGAEC